MENQSFGNMISCGNSDVITVTHTHTVTLLIPLTRLSMSTLLQFYGGLSDLQLTVQITAKMSVLLIFDFLLCFFDYR